MMLIVVMVLIKGYSYLFIGTTTNSNTILGYFSSIICDGSKVRYKIDLSLKNINFIIFCSIFITRLNIR